MTSKDRLSKVIQFPSGSLETLAFGSLSTMSDVQGHHARVSPDDIGRPYIGFQVTAPAEIPDNSQTQLLDL